MTALSAAEGMAAIADNLIKADDRSVITKLESLKVGSKVLIHSSNKAFVSGVEYEVRAIQRVSKTRFDLALLQVGKPTSEWREGKYLAAGKMIEFSNLIHRTWYANKSYNHFTTTDID